MQSIEEGSFFHCSLLKQVEITSSVTIIEYFAFKECQSLEEIKIPDSVTGKKSFEKLGHYFISC